MRNKRLPAKFIPKYMAALILQRENDKEYQAMKAKSLEDFKNIPDDPKQENIPIDLFLKAWSDMMDGMWMESALGKGFFSYSEKEIN